MAPVTTERRERLSARVERSSASSGVSDSSESVAVDRDAALQALAEHAGSVAAEERRRALRAFDDGEVSPTAHRVLSTLAVRVAVGAIAPAAGAIVEGDPQTVAAVATLFSPEE